MKFYDSVFGNKKQEQKPKYPDLPSVLQTKIKQNEKGQKSESKMNDRSSNMRESVLLKNKQDEQQAGWFKKLCACTQLQYYKDYFKVTNDDVKKRVLSNLKFWQSGFFQPAGQDYDFYGPFWIHTTIVFCLGAVHNILQYQGNPNYDYNFQILGEAFFLMYVLGFGLPIAIGFIMKTLGINVTIIQILCLFGYSSFIYILCIIACSFNICLLHWIFLGYGCANKIYFVFKNIQDGFEIPVSRKLLITILIIVQGALQFLLFKIRFIQCTDEPVLTAAPQKHDFQMHDGISDSFVHYRSYNHQTQQF